MFCKMLLVCTTSAMTLATAAMADSVPGFDTSTGEKLADGMGYVTLVRLEHQPIKANNGRVLISFETAHAKGMPLYESRDDGRSWNLVATAMAQGVKNPEECMFRWQPNLLELPRDSGSLKKGTLLLSGNVICLDESHRPFVENLQTYASTDLGRTWQFRGSIVDGIGHPDDRDNHGVWEPNLHVLDDGRLVAYYSSEKHKDKGFNQLLAHKTSRDGGATWGEETVDSAVPGGVERPGMAVVARLPDGRYAYTYEDIDGPDHNGQVYIKFSRDGLDWGNPQDRGFPIQTMGGAWPAACPVIDWFKIGGETGIMIVSAQRAGGTGDAGGRSLYWNNDLGRGPWWQIPAPVQKRSGTIGAGWTQALMLKRDGTMLHLTSSSTAATPSDYVSAGRNEILFDAKALNFNRYEAEDAARTHAAYIHDDAMSNRARVRIEDSARGRLDYDINVANAGVYPIVVRFAPATLEPAAPEMFVNGARVAGRAASADASWYTRTFTAKLTAGYNRISVVGGAHAADIDYIELGVAEK